MARARSFATRTTCCRRETSGPKTGSGLRCPSSGSGGSSSPCSAASIRGPASCARRLSTPNRPCSSSNGNARRSQRAGRPEQTLLFLERERATIAAGWPHFGQALANHPTAKQRDLSTLRAGNLPEFLPESIVPADPELRPNALGMTETCGPHTCVAEGPLPEALRGSHGVAVQGVEHKIVDPNTGKTSPPGETGEICVRGYSLM
ncbi:MAG: AMP-binding protein, partial [Deltaproteobacteria bacterium]|nr:AMP-binding protein [Deltaproteobacteria bacterium]